MRLHTALGGLLTLVAVASSAFGQNLPQTPGPKNAITDVPGIEVGHYTATTGSRSAAARREHARPIS